MDGVAYEFYDATGILMMSPSADDVTTDSILSSCYRILAEAGFKRICYNYDGDVTQLYFDTGLNCLITLVISSGQVGMAIQSFDKDAMGGILQYPKTALDESYPEGIRDYYPSFAVDGAVYTLEDEGENAYTLNISIQQGQNCNAIVRELKANLTADAGYTLVGDKYVSANGQIEITITSVENMLIVVHIQYLPPEEETVTYIFTDASSFDITDGEAVLYAYVWDNKGNGSWVELVYDEEIQAYKLETSSYIIGCKIVRFSPESVIDWAADAEGNVNEGVIIWNESNDIALSGQSSSLDFVINP